jgi:hypothetical protein
MPNTETVAFAQSDAGLYNPTHANAAQHPFADIHAVLRTEDGRTVADATADGYADPNAGTCCIAEPWTRSTRLVRFRRDDRIRCMDLASVSQLTAFDRENVTSPSGIPPLDRSGRVTTITRA